MLTVEEKEFVREKVLLLNDKTFREELFTFDNLNNKDFFKLVLILRNYEYKPNDFLWKRTNKKRAKDKYKNNRRKRITREEVSLLSFFKRLGVL